MKKLFHYEKCAVPELRELICDDVSYTVLSNIVGNTCDHIFTDGESIIICHSNPPYPVWIWCNDPKNDNIEMVRKCIKEFFPLENYSVIIPYEILHELKAADSYFEDVRLKMELFSYRLDDIQSINYPCDGQMALAEMADIDALAKIWQDMSREMEGFEFDAETCYGRVKELIDDKAFFVWRNGEGKIVATASKGKIDKFGKVAAVYTLPEERRRGYAINLVHGVTEAILGEGLVPTLYTDGGYSASNECYKKIGYVQVGRLCNAYKD